MFGETNESSNDVDSQSQKSKFYLHISHRFIESVNKDNIQSKKMEFNKLLCQTANKIDALRREFTENYFYMGGLEDDI